MKISKIFIAASIATMGFSPFASAGTKVQSKQDKEIECLAKNIYFESKGESTEGKYAVAQVTYNRSKNKQYPSTICQVVYQKYKSTCQFSWVCKKPTHKFNRAVWEQSKDIAQKVLIFGERHPTLKKKEALFFHANYVKPAWAGKMKRVAKIGNHIFYSKQPQAAKRVLVASN